MKKYETRWKVSPLNRAVWPIKGRILWEGQKEKKVLLWKEQGIGDDILFMGLVSEAARVSSSTIVYTDPRLVPLCQRGMPGITFKPYKGKIENEEFDYHLPMGSLPLLYRRSESDFKNTNFRLAVCADEEDTCVEFLECKGIKREIKEKLEEWMDIKAKSKSKSEKDGKFLDMHPCT